MSNHIKQLRGQIRQICKELLPEVMQEQIYETIRKEVHEGLAQIEKKHKESLEKMRDHQKEVLSYLTRQTTTKKSDLNKS